MRQILPILTHERLEYVVIDGTIEAVEASVVFPDVCDVDWVWASGQFVIINCLHEHVASHHVHVVSRLGSAWDCNRIGDTLHVSLIHGSEKGRSISFLVTAAVLLVFNVLRGGGCGFALIRRISFLSGYLVAEMTLTSDKKFMRISICVLVRTVSVLVNSVKVQLSSERLVRTHSRKVQRHNRLFESNLAVNLEGFAVW